MKKNIKSIFALSLAALMTGCSGNAYNNYYSVQARATDRAYTYMRDNMEMKFNGSSIIETWSELDGVKNTQSVKYEYQIDTINNVMHATRTNTTKTEHADNASLNVEEVEVSETYLIYKYDRGLVVYGISGEQKITYVMYTNADLYNQASSAASSSYFTALYGEPDIDTMASYDIMDIFYTIEMDVGTESLFESFFSAPSAEDFFSGCEIVEEKYTASANSKKFSFNVKAQEELVPDVTNDLTGTGTKIIEAKVNGGLIEKFYFEVSFEGTMDADPTPVPYKSCQSITTTASNGGTIKLIDFTDFKPITM